MSPRQEGGDTVAFSIYISPVSSHSEYSSAKEINAKHGQCSSTRRKNELY